MAWRRSPFGFWGEFDDRTPEMQRRLRERKAAFGIQQVPRGTGEEPGFPARCGEDVHVEIQEFPEEVVVIAGISPPEGEGLAIQFLDRRTLRIESEGHSRPEGRSRPFRTVFLPADVVAEEARASFNGGMLEVHLKKSPEVRGREISIERG